MEYNWDKEKLKVLKQEYIDLKRHTSGLTKNDKSSIQEKLNMIIEIENMLCLPTEYYLSLPTFPKYVDKTKYLPKSTFNTYQKVPIFIRKWILNTMHVLHSYESLPPLQYIPNFKLSDKELVGLSHDFFSWLPPKHYTQIADKYMDKKENLLRIQKKTYNTNYGKTYPFTYPIYVPYFLIFRQDTINDFLTLNHEIAHGIFYASDTNVSTSNNHQFLLELEGYFFNFLSIEFLKEKKIVPLEITKKLYCNEFINILDTNFIAFYAQYLSLLLYKEEKKIEIEGITKKLLEQQLTFEISESLLSSYLSEKSTELAKYALSALTSLDLEKMYTQDRELAFTNFEKIRYNKTNDIEKNLRDHGITFMDDKYQNLQEKMQQLSLTKK